MSRGRQSLMEQALESSSSDDDDEFFYNSAQIMYTHYQSIDKPKHGGSVPRHKVVRRKREAGHWKLLEDYFSDDPTYDAIFFRRRFRMSRQLFLPIMHAVENHDDYFLQKRNAANVLGLSCLQKVTAAFRMLTNGFAADATDEYICIGESTAIESMRRLVITVVEVFEEEYLRSPNQNDTARLLEVGEERGFPGMLCSIDCTHWQWKNCHIAWHSMYFCHVRVPTIILEAGASKDLWIWHAFFGLPRSHNDINVLQCSPLLAKLAEGEAPEVNYTINDHDYKMGYYLDDGIYPSWAIFVKTISQP